MRACQKDGLLRLERDRQGGLRVFASGGRRARRCRTDGESATRQRSRKTAETPPVVDAVAEVVAPPVVDAQVTEVVEDKRRRRRRSALRAQRRRAAKKQKAQLPRERAA